MLSSLRHSLWSLLALTTFLCVAELRYVHAEETDGQGVVAASDQTGQPAETMTEDDKKEASNKGGGAGDLLITRTRVVLDDKNRSKGVTLINKGTKEATYRVILKRMRMLEDGKYEEVDDKHPPKEGEAFADDVLRYSPRQVTLKPGQSQMVKFSMKGAGSIAPGEYRSHVLFQGNPDTSKGADIERGKDENKISVRIVPVYGISIPVIVRKGVLTAEASLSHVRLQDKTLSFVIERSGTKSVYGDVEVSDGDTVVGQLNGVAVFVPNARREVTMHLRPPEGTNISGKKLTILYKENADNGGKSLAQTMVGG